MILLELAWRICVCAPAASLPHLLRGFLVQTPSCQRGPQFADVNLPVVIQVQLPEQLGISPAMIRVRNCNVGTTTASFGGEPLLVFSHVKVILGCRSLMFHLSVTRGDMSPSARFARFYVPNVTTLFDRSFSGMMSIALCLNYYYSRIT